MSFQKIVLFLTGKIYKSGVHMENNEKTVDFGLPFLKIGILNFICFGCLLFDVKISLILLGVISILACIYLAYSDLKANAIHRNLLYVCYVLGCAINLFGLFYAFHLIAGQSVSMPRIAFAVLIFIELLPGYLLIKFYQSVVNKQLHKEYWDNYEKQQSQL